MYSNTVGRAHLFFGSCWLSISLPPAEGNKTVSDTDPLSSSSLSLCVCGGLLFSLSAARTFVLCYIFSPGYLWCRPAIVSVSPAPLAGERLVSNRWRSKTDGNRRSARRSHLSISYVVRDTPCLFSRHFSQDTFRSKRYFMWRPLERHAPFSCLGRHGDGAIQNSRPWVDDGSCHGSRQQWEVHHCLPGRHRVGRNQVQAAKTP